MAKRRSNLSLFLDSSILFSAVYSVDGGSSKLFTLEGVDLLSSNVVLTEVERNVKLKLPSYHLKRFFVLVEKLKQIISTMPSMRDISNAGKVIVQKDAVILSQFKSSECDILLTLDKKDFINDKVRRYIDPKKIVTTKQFYELYPDFRTNK